MTHVRTLRTTMAAMLAGALMIGTAGAAVADPPAKITGADDPVDARWQPAMDYDVEGCYPTPAISADGAVAEGLDLGGANNGNCRDDVDLDNTNTYARSAVVGNGLTAYMYGFYFEKDQRAEGVAGPGNGHRHDWEHVIVWVRGDHVAYVSASQHGGWDTRPASEVKFEGEHAKIVYHKDGPNTHAFRFAADADEPPENHRGAWQLPLVVSWNRFPGATRDTLVNHDFGSATLALKDVTGEDSGFDKTIADVNPEKPPA